MEKKKRRNLMQPSNMLTKTAIKKAGGVKELAALLGVTAQCIYAWETYVPKKREKQLIELFSEKKEGQ